MYSTAQPFLSVLSVEIGYITIVSSPQKNMQLNEIDNKYD